MMLSLRPKTIKVKPGDKLLGARVFNDLGPATKDTLLKQKRERWHEEMQKDIYIEETLNVISDIKLLTKGKSFTQKLSMN